MPSPRHPGGERPLSMARTRSKQDKDVISRIADSGEDALRRLVEMPRRIVVQAVDDVDERLHDLAAKVRELDPLHGRVAAIEKTSAKRAARDGAGASWARTRSPGRTSSRRPA